MIQPYKVVIVQYNHIRLYNFQLYRILFLRRKGIRFHGFPKKKFLEKKYGTEKI